MTKPAKLTVIAALLALTWISYAVFPGHTYLHSDTQIYLPIFENLDDPSLLREDLVPRGAHVSFTVYDEVSRLLRRLSGLSYEQVLTAQQLIWRGLGFTGVYWIGLAFGLPVPFALATAAAHALGATISGPSVLIIEYEPVPRGFAVPLLLFSLGAIARERWWLASAAASLAALYHPPSTLPFWPCFALLLFKRWRQTRDPRSLDPMAAPVAGGLLLAALAAAQPSIAAPQPFFGTIDPVWEELQRMRASYNWVSLWPAYNYWHYPLLALLGLAAGWRVRDALPRSLRYFAIGLPLAGLASLPLTWLLTEGLGWVLMPQVQLQRAVLWITAITVILAAVAGFRALRERRAEESFLWLLLVYAIPAQGRVFELLLEGWANPTGRARLLAVAISAAAVVGAGLLVAGRGPRFQAAVTAACLAPFLLLPGLGQVRNYPSLETPDLRDLASWARESTPPEALFLFPASGRALEPGIFRARARRTVYVDWKSGGQVNFLRSYAFAWWERWNAVMADGFDPAQRYREAGIHYLCVEAEHAIPGLVPVFENASYRVFEIAVAGGGR